MILLDPEALSLPGTGHSVKRYLDVFQSLEALKAQGEIQKHGFRKIPGRKAGIGCSLRY
jgi:hypothetical protein